MFIHKLLLHLGFRNENLGVMSREPAPSLDGAKTPLCGNSHPALNILSAGWARGR